MAIAATTDFWTSRFNGGDPSNLTGFGQDNNSFTRLTGSGANGAETADGSWRISGSGGQVYGVVPTTNDYTMVACFKYNTAPDDGRPIMTLKNGTHLVQVVSDGTTDKVKLVGSSTVTSSGGLDLGCQASFEPSPIMLRLTLDSTGNAKLYIREIVEDDDGTSQVLSVSATTLDPAGAKSIEWGNEFGDITWNNVYVSDMGAFSPDEMSTSPFVTDSLLRMGMSMVQRLKDSKRFFLKNYVDDSSIVYGFDISSDMISRIAPPSIHLILRQMDSPSFTTLGGSRIEQNFTVVIFVATRGSDYKSAYRSGMNIAGDIFDELYTTTGLLGTTDSLTNYVIQFDTKMDNDEVVCVHRMEMTYMRRLNLQHR
mgnify:FL=1|tara:strand:- start:172 stop:1275 length:1104 start_codon:yes stop_codon:yes gene_type:complete